MLKDGRILNPNLHDYKIATTFNVPRITTVFVEEHHDQGPYGAKGLAEPPDAPTAAAIANALYDAVGIRMKDLPITPDNILRALKR